jgi:hypothetical protein
MRKGEFAREELVREIKRVANLVRGVEEDGTDTGGR